MEAFSERRLEAAIVDVLPGLTRTEPGRGVPPRTIALALAAQGFGPLEPLGRHVLPMLELLELRGRVERMVAARSGGGSTRWRLVMPPLVSNVEPPPAA